MIEDEDYHPFGRRFFYPYELAYSKQGRGCWESDLRTLQNFDGVFD